MVSVPGRRPRLLLELDLTSAPVEAEPDDVLAKLRSRMYLQVQLVPLASVDDAPAALEAAREGELNNFRNRATTLSNDVVELGKDAVPGATNVTATEREIDTGGERSLVYSLYFSVGRYVVILVATDLYGGWEWNLVLACALAQVARLQPVENRAWEGKTP
jgi:hypothetical protein